MVEFNARLLRIEQGAPVADGLETPKASRVVWEGNIDAYLMIRQAREYQSDTSNTVRDTIVYLPDFFAARWVKVGQQLTLKQDNRLARFTVKDIVRSPRLDAIGATKIGIERA